jgi:putative transposase
MSSAKRVIEVLSRLVSVHGAPLFIRSDNGPEFVSHAIARYYDDGETTDEINPP